VVLRGATSLRGILELTWIDLLAQRPASYQQQDLSSLGFHSAWMMADEGRTILRMITAQYQSMRNGEHRSWVVGTIPTDPY
jgi:hypothetical protein